jgi:hypothetical protein
MIKTFTMADLLSWNPCGRDEDDDDNRYSDERLAELFAGRAELNPAGYPA